MLVGAATLQGMNLHISKSLRFISSKGARIHREGIPPDIPRSTFPEEVVKAMSMTDPDPWWLHAETLVNDPQAATWTYQGSEQAILTLVGPTLN